MYVFECILEYILNNVDFTVEYYIFLSCLVRVRCYLFCCCIHNTYPFFYYKYIKDSCISLLFLLLLVFLFRWYCWWFFHYFSFKTRPNNKANWWKKKKINKKTCLLHKYNLINILSKIKHNFLNGKQPTDAL